MSQTIDPLCKPLEKQHFPEAIACKRLTLKKHTLDLAQTMFAYVDQDRDRLRQFLPWVDATKTVQDEVDYIKMTHENWDNHEFYDFGIFCNETGIYMGNVGIHAIAWQHARCEIGYWILGDFEGQGFMSEAVTGLEEICFALGFHRVEIRCSSLNTRSASVPRRLGYVLEGVLRQNSLELGRYRDMLIFGKIASDTAGDEIPVLLG
jgi:RimJ/RimL family protein N-acetyltransferase